MTVAEVEAVSGYSAEDVWVLILAADEMGEAVKDNAGDVVEVFEAYVVVAGEHSRLDGAGVLVFRLVGTGADQEQHASHK